MSLRPRAGTLLCALALLGPAAGPVAAQLPSASTAALGFGDNYIAAARGYRAIAWNPANLAFSDNPQASLAFFPARAHTGLAPVTLADLARWSGKWVPPDVRTDWVQRIRGASKERGDIGADLTLAAVQVRSVGFQLSTSAHGLASINGDAAQLILFGNAPSGEAQDLHLWNSGLKGDWTSTAAVSYGRAFPFGRAGAHLAAGATLKFTLGHVVALGRDAGSTTTSDPLALNVRFPVIVPDSSSLFNNGSGVGLDIGGAYQAGPLTVSAALQNLFNTFAWNVGNLRSRSAEALWTQDTIQANSFADQPFSAAPADLRQEVRDLHFERTLLAGVAYRVNPRLLLAADLHQRFGSGGMQFGPSTQLGGGGEFRPFAFLPLRAGGALVTGGAQIAGGFGIELGTFAMSASVMHRSDNVGGSTVTMVTLISSFPRTPQR